LLCRRVSSTNLIRICLVLE